MNRDEQAVRLAVFRVLGERLAQADTDARALVRDGWHIGDRLTGTVAGHAVGAVQVKKPSVSASVTDSDAFMEWVAANRPTEVEEIVTRRVRPAYVTAVLSSAKQLGAAVTSGGEEIPGVTVTTGKPSVAVTLEDNAAELVSVAWQSGELWELLGELLPALESTGTPAGGEA